MTAMRLAHRLILASALFAQPPAAAANIGHAEPRFAERILMLHNRERAAVGVPPLSWDWALAQSAAAYGPALERIGTLVHSPRAIRPGQRENLAMSTTGYLRESDLVGLWIAEKHHFTPGTYPNVSRTGRWNDVSHYTQMIWRGTTRVGCALHRGGGKDFLICRYTPPGNADGKVVP